MELNEAAQRLVKHHLVLIVVLCLIGFLIPAAVLALQDDTYVARSRVLIGAPDANGSQQANALADTALGIVTSRQVVDKVLADTDVQRESESLAEDRIEVVPIGTSSVLQLSVSDPDPQTAAVLANALSAELAVQRNQVLTGEYDRLLNDVNERILAATQNITDIESAVARLDAPVSALELRHDEAVRARSDLEGLRQRLTEARAATTRASVVAEATPPTKPAPSGLAARTILGGLLGLLIALGISALLEALRPTIAPAALSRLLGVPLLGHLPRPPQQDTELRDPWLPSHLSMAATNAGVHRIQLTPVGPPVALSRLARWLRERPQVIHEVEVLHLIASPQQEAVTASHLDAGAGVVVVAPTVLRLSALEVLKHHLAITRRPLLGIIIYRHHDHGRPNRPESRAEVPQATERDLQPSVVHAS